MRWLTIALVAFLAAAVPSSAQGEGCTQDDPCLLEVDVDETGFTGQREWTLIEGDWHQIVVANLDVETDHTVRLDRFGIVVEVSAVNESMSAPFRLDAPGDFELVDEPTGDVAWVTVTALDPSASETSGATETTTTTTTTTPAATDDDGDAGGDEDAPALWLGVSAACLLALVLRRR